MQTSFTRNANSAPGSAAHLVCQAVEKLWLQIPRQGQVILAVSGGVDSMVLLEAMHRGLSAAHRGRVLVAHVNHGLRGGESDHDALLVEARAREMGFSFRGERIVWQEREPHSQDACRRRREAFFQACLCGENDRIWLAHHLNDQAETIFFRLLRGTGARGLRGILPVQGRKLRPFLALEKETLLKAAAEWKVRWREDASNADPDAYERNWIRSFFPQLEARRPGFQRRLAELGAEAQGWKFVKEPAPEFFEAGEGIRFARFSALPSPGALAATFRLGRRHAHSLSTLLARSAGTCETEGARFRWSAGILLEERQARFSPAAGAWAGTRWESALGIWEGDAELPFWREDPGEKGKKAYQALRVPLFFRPAIPLFRSRARLLVAHPARLSGAEGLPRIRFQPSSLGKWWLGLDPSVKGSP